MSRDDYEDSPPCIPPPPPSVPVDEVDLRDTTPAPPPVERYLTADQGAVITQVLAELVQAVSLMRTGIVAEVKNELSVAVTLIRGDIDGVREEVREQSNRIASKLDRDVDKRLTETAGKLDGLAIQVSDLRHAIDEHRRMVERVSTLAYSLAQQSANENGPELAAVEAEQ